MKTPHRIILGDCYRQAYRLMVDHEFDYYGDRWMLCHGIVIGTGVENNGKHCGHAWIENEDCNSILDASGHWFMKPSYYMAAQVSFVHRYTLKEAFAEAEKSGLYGPWDQKIIDSEKWIKKEPKCT